MTSAAASPGDLSKRSYWGCWWPARFCTCRGSCRICRACRSQSSRESTRLLRLQAHRCGKQQQLSPLMHTIYMTVKIAWVMCAAWKEKMMQLTVCSIESCCTFLQSWLWSRTDKILEDGFLDYTTLGREHFYRRDIKNLTSLHIHIYVYVLPSVAPK